MIFFKKKETINFSIVFLKNPKNLKNILTSLKKQKTDEVFFIISSNVNENEFKLIKKRLKTKNCSLIYKEHIKLSKRITIVKDINVKKLRTLENKKYIIFSNNYMLSWKIAQMFPFYTISFDKNFLCFCTPIPLTKDATGFLLKRKLEKDFIFNIKLDFKIIKDILGG
ncbi:hypothetical protein SU69_05985 [Thermosipho melanesiensis]|uniref:Uncharacterized protein n=2 Tax=Thermosipho melanesiensis TaxID=46541 RepID=A6LM80_THEM4|nr:hypothetical protein [Thermosipho melanesiensis]ABR31031.1 hypothetical protein Tmel_1177 [Thermosipho melanesiensis BI429]APT74125.1 hypothetical protein BW47_06280 [Thermosipho melanesiensis]OOC36073.1 hypothetical protein SU68_06055 [Thermosipho melanesiensis]OOC36890.1 hypothetical protein SU69_05985 [Thermosipho melanesiensis]OOC37641.1 hypothetical protein SU70_05995 [Thermosipho melanesiensis]